MIALDGNVGIGLGVPVAVRAIGVEVRVNVGVLVGMFVGGRGVAVTTIICGDGCGGGATMITVIAGATVFVDVGALVGGG